MTTPQAKNCIVVEELCEVHGAACISSIVSPVSAFGSLCEESCHSCKKLLSPYDLATFDTNSYCRQCLCDQIIHKRFWSGVIVDKILKELHSKRGLERYLQKNGLRRRVKDAAYLKFAEDFARRFIIADRKKNGNCKGYRAYTTELKQKHKIMIKRDSVMVILRELSR